MVQFFNELLAVEYTVFESRRHGDGTGWTSLNTEVAHGTEFEVVNKSVDGFFAFAFRCGIELGDDLNGSVGAG